MQHFGCLLRGHFFQVAQHKNGAEQRRERLHGAIQDLPQLLLRKFLLRVIVPSGMLAREEVVLSLDGFIQG